MKRKKYNTGGCKSLTVNWVETEPVRYIVIVVSMASPADPFSISKMPRTPANHSSERVAAHSPFCS
jgi:hypothetical protein